ncbi:MAG: hypothetical protein LUE23_02740 [Lachnospiraceae bacterium]|nr:hypothetical protein [Lachnospiraceae bacterium]
MKKKWTILTVAGLTAAMLTGCSTNAAEHASTYFSQIKEVLYTATNSQRLIAEAEAAAETEEVDENALSKPANFTVDEEGNYSFDAVENAEYYYVYIYEDSSTKEATASLKVMEDGSSTYTGNVTDILAGSSEESGEGEQETTTLGYGAWSIRVAACPDYENTDYTASGEAKCEYLVTGEVDYGDPQFSAMWNIFDNELTISVTGMNCSTTAYPTDIILTLTNTEDSSDVVTIDITDIDDDSVEGVTTDAQAGATYEISAEFVWDANYVTNPEYTVEGGSAETSSTDNLLTGEFYYVDDIYYSFGFPHVQLNFDPETGGQAGVWYKDPASVTTGGFSTSDEEETDEEEDKNCYFEATPKDAENGALYSFDIVITSPAGKIYATPYTDSGQGTTIIWGSMDVFEDGTFSMELEYQYILTDTISSGVYYVPGAICYGSYTTNSDGTLNLSYDHTNCSETDYEVVTELTGKAAEYAEENPDFEQVFVNPFN